MQQKSWVSHQYRFINKKFGCRDGSCHYRQSRNVCCRMRFLMQRLWRWRAVKRRSRFFFYVENLPEAARRKIFISRGEKKERNNRAVLKCFLHNGVEV